jgi:hypothetical protein
MGHAERVTNRKVAWIPAATFGQEFCRLFRPAATNKEGPESGKNPQIVWGESERTLVVRHRLRRSAVTLAFQRGAQGLSHDIGACGR